MDVGTDIASVETCDRQVFGNTQPGALRDSQPGDRHRIVRIHDRGGAVGRLEHPHGSACTIRRGEIRLDDERVVEARVAQRRLERLRASSAMEHRRRSADVRDAPVPEFDEVSNGGPDTWAVVERDRGEGRRDIRMSECDSLEPEALDEGETRVAATEVAQDDAVDAPVLGQAAVGVDFGGFIGHHAQHEGLTDGRKGNLDARDERGEERVAGDDVGVAGDDEAEGECGAGAQRARPQARTPAELVGDPEDAFPCVRRNAGTIIEGERDEPLADAGLTGHIGDGGLRVRHAGILLFL